MSTHSHAETGEVRLAPTQTKVLMQAAIAVLVLGIVLSIAAALSDPHRFAFSYLAGFMFVCTLGLGGLFFVLLQYVTRAGWSVGPRRQMEWLAGILPFTAILFLPIAYFVPVLYTAWVHPDTHAIGYDMLEKKFAYLNIPFFYVRAAIYFVIWTALSLYYRNTSLKQDRTADPSLTSTMQNVSAPGLYLFGFSLTFAAFDWLMSLTPAWYSTMFGVYIFAGSTTSSLALLSLMTISLQKTGLMGAVSTVEHRHDIGKLLFGFTVFWAYIAFGQFFLIWYANIPEETIWYHMRWFTPEGAHSSWMPVSVFIIFGHFWVPFLILLSRHVKRNYFGLALGASIMLVMHYVDLYWVVMPVLDKEFHPSWIDLAGLLLPVGALAVWLVRRASLDPVYPVNDPRLPEAVQLVNL